MQSYFKNIAICFIFLSCNDTNFKEPSPSRPTVVPENSIWAGGVDGGNWFNIKKGMHENHFQITIYNDNNGEIDINAEFVLDSSCTIKNIDSATLTKSIIAYDGEKILLELPAKDHKYCFLTPR